MTKKWITEFVASLTSSPSSEDQSIRQDRPRFDRSAAGYRYYVYVHEDEAGNVFYVGKGTDRRAWEYGRDPAWNYYVKTRLSDRYNVRIVENDLSEEDALAREESLMRQHGDRLINLQNMSRGLDMEALKRRDALIKNVNDCIASAKRSTDAARKITLLRQALQDHYLASPIRIERGLFGEIHAEMVGAGFGNTELIRLLVDAYLDVADPGSAQAALDEYTTTYPAHADVTVVRNLRRAIAKGKPRAKQAQTEFVPPDTLPGDWERAAENKIEVIRLRRDIDRPNGPQEEQLSVLAALEKSGDTEAVLRHLKGCIVKDEGMHPAAKVRELWLYPHYRAISVCRKAGNTQEECLFLLRLIHHSQGHHDLGDLEARLRRAAALLERKGSSKR